MNEADFVRLQTDIKNADSLYKESISSLEFAVVNQDKEAIELARMTCHEAVDQLLDAQQRMYELKYENFIKLLGDKKS